MIKIKTGVLTTFIFFCLICPSFQAVHYDVASDNTVLKPLGDELKDSLAYDYLYAPENSFGVKVFNNVNIGFYRNWLNETIAWSCEKSSDNKVWKDASKCLLVERVWDKNNRSEKHTLIITSDEDAYYRVLLKTNIGKSLINYDDKSEDTRFDLDFKVTESEWYNISYNWSDFEQSKEYSKANISKQITSDISNKKSLEWDVYTTVKIGEGEKFVIDPWFGFQGTGGTANSCNGRAQGLWATTAGDGAGKIESISVYLYRWTDGSTTMNTRCALFDSSKVLIDETADILWPINSPEATTWVTHTFSTAVTVTASTTYIIAVCSDADGAHSWAGSFWTVDGLTMQYNDALVSPPAFDDPMGGSTYAGYTRPIYANYEVAGNNAPTITGEHPTNGSTGEELSIAVGCTVNDADAEDMEVTFATSPDGSAWTNVQTNSTVADGTGVNYTYSGASSYSTKYYWKVYADDGTDNTTSATWDFTTKAEAWSNTDPVISGEQPSNQSTSQELTPACGVTLTDSDANHTFNVTYASNYSDGSTWVNYQTNSSVSNPGTVNWTFSGASACLTKYWWQVFCHDGFSNVSKRYHFTTLDNVEPAIKYETPTPSDDGSTSNNYVTVNVSVSDASDNISAYIDWNQSLAGCWNFDYLNSTGVFDNSTNDNFGVFTGGLAVSDATSGKYGDAMLFDGSGDYIDCGSDTSLKMTDAVTMEIWLKTTASGRADPAGRWDGNSPYPGYGFTMGNAYGSVDAGKIGFWVGDDTDKHLSSTKVINDDVWHHIVATYDGTTVKLYIDGLLDNSGARTNGLSGDANFYMALRTDGAEKYGGMIDQLRVWNRAITHEEINASYNAKALGYLSQNYSGLTELKYPFYANAIDLAGNDNITDTRNVTVAFTPIWIDITNASWELGNIEMGSYIWTNETGKTFIADKDNCTVTTDLKLQITTDAADWTASTSGNGPGVDVYRLNASVDNWATEVQIVTASATTISSNIAADENEPFDLRFDAPTATSVGTEQTIVVTATLIQS